MSGKSKEIQLKWHPQMKLIQLIGYLGCCKWDEFQTLWFMYLSSSAIMRLVTVWSNSFASPLVCVLLEIDAVRPFIQVAHVHSSETFSFRPAAAEPRPPPGCDCEWTEGSQQGAINHHVVITLPGMWFRVNLVRCGFNSTTAHVSTQTFSIYLPDYIRSSYIELMCLYKYMHWCFTKLTVDFLCNYQQPGRLSKHLLCRKVLEL